MKGDYMKALTKAIAGNPAATTILHQFWHDFKVFSSTYEITPNNKWLYAQSFMHSSYINDLNLTKIYNNERLEFLGDAVLELNVSDYLYERFPNLPEGELTKLRANIVCEPSLVVFSKHLDMPHLIMLGKGEEKTGGRERPSIISDAFEAFLGAMYIDLGNAYVVDFLNTHIYPLIQNETYNQNTDFKTTLQELVHQQKSGEVTYELMSESGPSHNKIFTTGVFINNRHIASGTGRSKKLAEQRAAEAALNIISD